MLDQRIPPLQIPDTLKLKVSDQELQCPFCSKTSSRGTGMASHIRGAHPEQYLGWSRGRKGVQQTEGDKTSLKPFDREILEAAILGYQVQIGRIEEKIATIKQHLAGSAPSSVVTVVGGIATPNAPLPTIPERRAKRKSRMTPEGRQRLVAALKRRGAAKKASEAGSPAIKKAAGERGRPKKSA